MFELVADAHIAMMANLGEHGRWHARPMATGKEPIDGALWFLTDARSGKIEETRAGADRAAAYSDEAAGRYVSISGTASIIARAATRSARCGRNRRGPGFRAVPTIPISR